MQEEFLIQGESKRTVIKYFTTFSGQTSDDNSTYFVITDSNNNFLKLVESEMETKFGLDPLNYNIPLSAITQGYNVYTGTVITTERNLILPQNAKDLLSTNYVNSINLNSNNTASTYSTVIFEEYPFNDYYMNVKINRSVDTLDTLNIYNVPINETTKFTNNKGVLFGKIDAIQVLLDESGEKYKIPLKNAVVGIFNPSEEIPSIGSVDPDGNRIRLNLYENLPIGTTTSIQSYGSFQSYLTDINYSPKDIENDLIPPKYKYTTLTNDNGEFVLHNIPTGQQTLMLEVDLLKQGLEPEEVALNFFPYPTTDDPNVSNIPHLYFNQFPVNIVPSWGDFQTGYTEIKISIVLDLRKWITYYTYPISSKTGNPNQIGLTSSNSAPKVLEELLIQGVTNKFTVRFRDMTKPFVTNDPPRVEMVKIVDIYDRNFDLNLSWNNEFKIRNNKVEFDTTNFNAFKLPANLYDPVGINTKGQTGVWLGAYQIKIEYPGGDLSFQSTGYQEEWPPNPAGGAYYLTANHFDLNRYDGWNTNATTSPNPGEGIGKWPYQQPWTINYPEKYKIARKPRILNPLKTWDSSGNPIYNVSIVNQNGVSNNYTLTSGEFYLQPKYLDGDLVGGDDAWGTTANGYGLQNYHGAWGGNNFSREVTKNEIWKYEGTDWWGQDYSNNFLPGCTSQDADKYPDAPNFKPDVDGDKFQRLEAGYAYWLRPRGWPRIKNESWGDHLLENDFDPLADHNTNSVFSTPWSYNSYYFNIYNYIDEVTLQVGANAPFLSKFGRLNIYRVERPYYTNKKKPPFTEKFAKFNFQSMMVDQSTGNDRCKECISDSANQFIWLERGGFNSDSDKNRKKCNTQFVPLEQNTGAYNARTSVNLTIYNIGTTKVSIYNGNGQFVECEVGRDKPITVYNVSSNSVLTLPANDSYNPTENYYDGASYLIYISSVGTSRDNTGGGSYVNPIYKYSVGPLGQEVNYYLSSLISRQVGLGGDKCSAVRDYNTNQTTFFGNILGVLSLALGVPAIMYAFNILQARDNIDSYIRNLFSSPEQYNADDRQNQNLGVFINGLAFCAPYFSNGALYLDNRGKTLPYVGQETKKASDLNWRFNTPFFGDQWYWKMQLSCWQYPVHSPSVFQPKKMHENNLKGYNNTPYFMEFPLDPSSGIIYEYKNAF